VNSSLSLAILRYEGASETEPAMTPAPTPTNRMLEQNLHTLINPGSPGGDVEPDMSIVFNITQPNGPFWEINGISWVPPSVPALLAILSGAAEPADFVPTEHLFVLPRNAIIEVNIPGGGAHPFHLHGHVFDVIQSSNSAERNFVNPIKRDVVAINGGIGALGNTTVRFFTDNPGPWIFHCQYAPLSLYSLGLK
jgi:iron transport multicopper oxidase